MVDHMVTTTGGRKKKLLEKVTIPNYEKNYFCLNFSRVANFV